MYIQFLGFITMCNLQKRLIRAASPASDVYERLETNGTTND